MDNENGKLACAVCCHQARVCVNGKQLRITCAGECVGDDGAALVLFEYAAVRPDVSDAVPGFVERYYGQAGAVSAGTE